MASWTKIRKQVLERDNHTCQGRGPHSGKLHAHHKRPRYDGGTDDLDNLTTLCQSCHTTLHTEELRQMWAEQDRIGWAQYEAMKQCERDYITQTGGQPQLDEAYGEFSKNWPGWANVPQYR